MLDYRSYQVQTTGSRVSIARSRMREKASRNRRERLYQRLMRPMPGLSAPESEQWNFIFAFPGATFNLYPDQIDFWCNYPLDERRTRSVWHAFRPPETAGRRDRWVRRLNTSINILVQEEDNDLTARVQEGLGSSLYRAGILGARENGLLHFHDLIRRAIPAAAADDERDGARLLGAEGVPAAT
jgi:Rieske 2Fe-2S family protein